MSHRHRALLLVGLAAAACSETGLPTERALAWLRTQQHADGLWHSATYGMLRRGESTTAAIVFAMAQLPEAARSPHSDMIGRALAALDGRKAPSPGSATEPIDYPCWTAVHRLHAVSLLRPEGWRRQADELIAFLRSRQLGPANGWPAEAPEFGAFGLGEREPQFPDGGDLAGLAHTTAALEALTASGLSPSDPMVMAMRTFVERCQDQSANSDGGFVYAPTGDWRATKAGRARDEAGDLHPRSYGTATADGILALLTLGDVPDSPRLQRAIAWLDACATRHVPGLQYARDATVEPSMRLYWLMRLAKVARCMPQHPSAGRWRSLVAEELAGLQVAAGRFVGLAAAMKEDDPLVATALGLMAISALPAAGR